MTRTIEQNKKLHALITELNIRTEHKAELVYSFTNERTESSSEMTVKECADLITWCENQKAAVPTPTAEEVKKCQNMRRKILAICHTLGWYVKHLDGRIYLHNGKPVLDFVRIDAFCKERGNAHKPLQEYTSKELATLVTIFNKL